MSYINFIHRIWSSAPNLSKTYLISKFWCVTSSLSSLITAVHCIWSQETTNLKTVFAHLNDGMGVQYTSKAKGEVIPGPLGGGMIAGLVI